MSCTLIRTLPLARCTVPSTTVATPNCCETVFRSSGLLLYFAVEISDMPLRPPMFVFSQIVGDSFGEKDVSGIGAGHDALRHIKTSPGKVGLTVHIDHAAD